MADFSTAWVPDYGMYAGPGYNTRVSRFEGGVEQRREKWSNPVRRFRLTYGNKAYATIDAIRAFFEARSGAYESFNFPVFSWRIMGARLSCVDGGGSNDCIRDSSNELITRGFVSGAMVAVAGSIEGNDGFHDLTGVAAGTLTMPTGTLADSESSNAGLIIYPAFTARFVSDVWEQVMTGPYTDGTYAIDLVEVI